MVFFYTILHSYQEDTARLTEEIKWAIRLNLFVILLDFWCSTEFAKTRINTLYFGRKPLSSIDLYSYRFSDSWHRWWWRSHRATWLDSLNFVLWPGSVQRLNWKWSSQLWLRVAGCRCSYWSRICASSRWRHGIGYSWLKQSPDSALYFSGSLTTVDLIFSEWIYQYGELPGYVQTLQQWLTRKICIGALRSRHKFWKQNIFTFVHISRSSQDRYLEISVHISMEIRAISAFRCSTESTRMLSISLNPSQYLFAANKSIVCRSRIIIPYTILLFMIKPSAANIDTNICPISSYRTVRTVYDVLSLTFWRVYPKHLIENIIFVSTEECVFNLIMITRGYLSN